MPHFLRKHEPWKTRNLAVLRDLSHMQHYRRNIDTVTPAFVSGVSVKELIKFTVPSLDIQISPPLVPYFILVYLYIGLILYFFAPV